MACKAGGLPQRSMLIKLDAVGSFQLLHMVVVHWCFGESLVHGATLICTSVHLVLQFYLLPVILHYCLIFGYVPNPSVCLVVCLLFGCVPMRLDAIALLCALSINDVLLLGCVPMRLDAIALLCALSINDVLVFGCVPMRLDAIPFAVCSIHQ